VESVGKEDKSALTKSVATRIGFGAALDNDIFQHVVKVLGTNTAEDSDVVEAIEIAEASDSEDH
jgi:hypothetical protein